MKSLGETDEVISDRCGTAFTAGRMRWTASRRWFGQDHLANAEWQNWQTNLAARVTNVWLGDAKEFSLQRTDGKGEIVIDVRNVQPFEIRVLPSTYADCRFKGDQMSGRLVRYSLAEIISTGVVGENLCGKTRVSPTPGVLVVYVRPRSFIEAWKL